MVLTEVHQVRQGHKLYKFLDELSYKSKSIYNMANYLIRQEFIRTSKLKEEGLLEHATWLRWMELDKLLKGFYKETYSLLPAKSVQLILKNLDESWNSFFGSIRKWKSDKSKFKGRPRLPKYKDKVIGRNIVILNNQQFKVKDGIVYFLSSLTKDLNFKPIKTKILEEAKLIQITISPRRGYYNFNIVYDLPSLSLKATEGLERKTGVHKDLNLEECMAIDIGINNFCTVSNTVDKDFFIINGRSLKSVNQWANKFQAYSSVSQKRKNKVWRKRENKLSYFFHKTSNFLIEKALSKGCKSLVVGYNQEWKQNVNLGRKTNQSFVQIPYHKFLFLLEYKCNLANIELVKLNEAYTSKCSFIDIEPIGSHEIYKGRRVFRGLFRSLKGVLINADLNGSLNILRKYLGTKFQLETPDQVEDFVVSPYRVSFSC